jgi:hypothetical protein
MGRVLRRGLLFPTVASAALLSAGIATAAGPSVTITRPAAGAVFSRSATPKLTATGTASFAAPVATSTKFYLRRDGCGTSNDNPHLSVTSGVDKGDGCGFVLGVVGPSGEVDHSLSVDFPTEDGMPATFDSSRPLTGVLELDNLALNGVGTAAGQVTVTFTVEALVKGAGVPVGSDSETVLVTPPNASYQVPFRINPSSALNRQDLSGLDLNVAIGGPYLGSGFIGLSGHSYLLAPTYSASFRRVVQLSVDDPTFGKPITTALNSTFTSWGAAISTPPVGEHTLYVRAVQGFTASPVASRTFTVTS